MLFWISGERERESSGDGEGGGGSAEELLGVGERMCNSTLPALKCKNHSHEGLLDTSSNQHAVKS